MKNRVRRICSCCILALPRNPSDSNYLSLSQTGILRNLGEGEEGRAEWAVWINNSEPWPLWQVVSVTLSTEGSWVQFLVKSTYQGCLTLSFCIVSSMLLLMGKQSFTYYNFRNSRQDVLFCTSTLCHGVLNYTVIDAFLYLKPCSFSCGYPEPSLISKGAW